MLKLYGLVFLSIQLSTCVNPPRMVKYFQYDVTPEQALDSCRAVLDQLDYTVEIYAPESKLLITTTGHVKKDLRRFSYNVIIQVEDVIHVYLVAKRHIFKRGSETSIGGQELTAMQTTDRLPYSIQQKIFWPIIVMFEEKGFPEFDRSIKGSPQIGFALMPVSETNSTSIIW